MITKPTLITAFSAYQTTNGGKRTKRVAAVDGDRDGVPVIFGASPDKLEIEFKDEIEFIDVTVENDHYAVPAALSGMGWNTPDIRPFLDPTLKKHTYRFKLPAVTAGTLVFTTPGGAGFLRLYDISGFINKEIKL